MPSFLDLAPGLLFLLGAALLAACVRRRDRPHLAVLIAAASVIGVSFAPVLFQGRTLLPFGGLVHTVPFTEMAPPEPFPNPLQGDLLLLIAPAAAEARDQLAEGRWPQWRDRVGAGMPLLADPQAQVAQPFALFAAPLLPSRSPATIAALRIWAAFVFTFAFIRRQGLEPTAAALGAAAFAFGGFVMLWLGWPLASSAAALPALLYAVSRVMGRQQEGSTEGALDRLFLVGAVAATLLSGHPETAAYCLGLALLVTLAEARSRALREGEGSAKKPVAAAAIAAALAAGICAPILLPTAFYLPSTLRATRLAQPAPEPVGGAVERATHRLAPLVAPYAFGNSRWGSYWGPSNTNEDASGYVGMIPLTLVGLALVRRRGRRPYETLMLGVAAGAALIVAQPPGVVDLLGLVPGGWSSDYHHRLLLPLSFALAYIAASELDRRRAGGGRPWSPWLAAGSVLALAAAAVWAFPHPQDPDLLDVVRFGWLNWQMRFAMLGALALSFAPRRLWAGGVLVAAVAAELLLAHRPAYPPAPLDHEMAEPPPLERALAEVARTGGRIAGQGSVLPPNLAALYGLADARVYNPMAPQRYFSAIGPVIESWDGEEPRFGKPEDPVWDRFGVALWLTSAEERLAPPATLLVDDPSGRLWRRPGAQPLVSLPETAIDAGEEDRLGDAGTDRGETRVTSLGSGRWTAARPAEGSLRVESTTPAHLVAEVSAPERRLVLSSVFQDGGWRLLVDGRRVPAVRAHRAFVAGWSPAGRHRVDLVYRAPGLLAGVIVAAVALSLLAAWLAPSLRGRDAKEGAA